MTCRRNGPSSIVPRWSWPWMLSIPWALCTGNPDYAVMLTCYSDNCNVGSMDDSGNMVNRVCARSIVDLVKNFLDGFHVEPSDHKKHVNCLLSYEKI